MIVVFILALSWLAAAVGLLARSAEAATSFTLRADVRPLREHRVRPGPDACRARCALRRAPAVHADHRDDARPVDGAHLDRRAVGHEAWIAVGLLRGILVVVVRRGVLAVPAPDRGLTPASSHPVRTDGARLEQQRRRCSVRASQQP